MAELSLRDSPATEGMIPLCVPYLAGREWDYVKECLDGNWVSSVGPFVDRFEAEFAAYIGVEHAIAMGSGTAALHVALLVAGVGPDDEVLVPALTFIAPANAVRYCQAWPVFIDVEPSYWQMDIGKVGRFLEEECAVRDGTVYNRASGRRVRAVIPVHALGHPVDMEPLARLARRFGLTVIEDASESLGATYKGTMVGGLGDIAVFSFNGNKLITTGGGGMLVTDDAAVAEKARYLSTQAKDDPIEYIHNEVGYNYRLSNVHAAMGSGQLENIQARLDAKRGIAEAYRAGLGATEGIALPEEAPWASSAWWLYTVLVDEATFGLGSRVLLQRLADAGVQTRPLWQPLHLSKAHGTSQAYHCEVAEGLYRDALTLPSSVGLTPNDQKRVIEALRRARTEAVTATGA